MPLLLLFAAIAVEVFATSMLKATEGFTRIGPTALCLAGYLFAFTAVARVVQHMPVGVVYAVWSGAGTAAVAAIGVLFLDEQLDAARAAGIALVIVGVVLLNLGTQTA